MKVYLEEVQIYKAQALKKYPTLSTEQEETLQNHLLEIRAFSRRKTLHFLMQLIPYVVLLGSLFVLLNWIIPSIDSVFLQVVVLSILHGAIGYQFVVYTLHEGAGHGLFRGNKLFNFLAFNSSRLFFADPRYYKKAHQKHHAYLGTEKDASFSHFVFLKRVIKSMLPGAGILFPNDYCIHTDGKLSRSLIFSFLVGLSFMSLEFYVLKEHMPLWAILLSLALLGPWVGMVLDRLRETIEHHMMPADKKYGSREIGLKGLAFFIAGGPWGQPFHFSHHFSPELNWYQQILLHRKLKTILNKEQSEFYGFEGQSMRALIWQTFKNLNTWTTRSLNEKNI